MAKSNYYQEILTLETCIKVIEDSENGLPQLRLAKKYNCGRTHIQRILQNKQHLIEKWFQSGNELKQECAHTVKEINELTFFWFEDACSRGIPVNGPLLQQKAIHFASCLKMDSFFPTNTWLNKFCKRYNIAFNESPAKIASKTCSIQTEQSQDQIDDLGGHMEIISKSKDKISTCDENYEQKLNEAANNSTVSDKNKVPPLPINESLHTIARLKHTALELDDKILLDLLEKAELRIKNAIMLKINKV